MAGKDSKSRIKDGDTVCFIKEHMAEAWEAVLAGIIKTDLDKK